ncbi:MAG TPA: c-type cytochrome [Vicinamibacterales bacterium]|nr:c-type cytochrome [Vicinamibacterales bacterium]
MPVVRLFAVSSLLFLIVVVSLSGQQPPAATAAAGAQQAAAGPKISGDLEHGRYLVERVVMCYECHSTRDPQGNIMPGTKFKGGPMPFRPAWSGDWPIQIPRIAGLPGYTDELAIRLLTQGGIRWDGQQLRAPMPRFRMSPQDAADVIAYLRSL